MLGLSLREIAQLANGKLNNEKFADLRVQVVSIDTRTIAPGELYMPIIGEKLDGHLFINQAFDKGALASFTHKENLIDDRPFILVENTNQAFQDLAKNFRNSLDNLKIIGITGSNGKTTTKDIINSILKQKFNVRKTIGNLNNEIGVPRTLLRLEKNTDVGIVEMGTDGPGQIHKLTMMAKPDMAIITNIGDSHLELLKTKENIAREKLHIVDGLSDDGYFIYNYDDPILKKEVEAKNIKQKMISFGQEEGADYHIELLRTTANGSSFKVNNKYYQISLIGSHQIYNAAAAIIVAELLGMTEDQIISGLDVKNSTSMRNELISCNGFDILNDSYKSNPQSLKSALDTLGYLNGYKRKIAILGDMLELGQGEENLHREIGSYINPKEVDYLLLYGPLSRYIAEEALRNFPDGHVFYMDKKEDLIDKAKYLIIKNSIVLVKASRSLRLEEIVEALELINI